MLPLRPKPFVWRRPPSLQLPSTQRRRQGRHCAPVYLQVCCFLGGGRRAFSPQTPGRGGKFAIVSKGPATSVLSNEAFSVLLPALTLNRVKAITRPSTRIFRAEASKPSVAKHPAEEAVLPLCPCPATSVLSIEAFSVLLPAGPKRSEEDYPFFRPRTLLAEASEHSVAKHPAEEAILCLSQHNES